MPSFCCLQELPDADIWNLLGSLAAPAGGDSLQAQPPGSQPPPSCQAQPPLWASAASGPLALLQPASSSLLLCKDASFQDLSPLLRVSTSPSGAHFPTGVALLPSIGEYGSLCHGKTYLDF